MFGNGFFKSSGYPFIEAKAIMGGLHSRVRGPGLPVFNSAFSA